MRAALAVILFAGPALAGPDVILTPRPRARAERHRAWRRAEVTRHLETSDLRRQHHREGRVARYRTRGWAHWRDLDRDCRDTRDEILIRDSRDSVQFFNRDQCHVSKGRWICPYTGAIFTEVEDLEVDHVVPPRHAWSRGMDGWDRKKRHEFYNDPDNLMVVARAIKQVKDSYPEEGILTWKPPRRAFWGEYARRWRAVKERYGIESDAVERAHVWRLMREHPGDGHLEDPDPPARLVWEHTVAPRSFADLHPTPAPYPSARLASSGAPVEGALDAGLPTDKAYRPDPVTALFPGGARAAKGSPTGYERAGYPTAVLDPNEAAAYLAVSRSDLLHLVEAGRFPHTRIGDKLRFRVQDLDAYLARRTIWR